MLDDNINMQYEFNVLHSIVEVVAIKLNPRNLVTNKNLTLFARVEFIPRQI